MTGPGAPPHCAPKHWGGAPPNPTEAPWLMPSILSPGLALPQPGLGKGMSRGSTQRGAVMVALYQDAGATIAAPQWPSEPMCGRHVGKALVAALWEVAASRQLDLKADDNTRKWI